MLRVSLTADDAMVERALPAFVAAIARDESPVLQRER